MIDLNNDALNNYPLEIFTKLYAENKNNKVYEECLKEEIKKTIETLSEEMSFEEILVLKSLIDLNKDAINAAEDIIDDLLKTKLEVMQKIINEVYENKVNEQTRGA